MKNKVLMLLSNPFTNDPRVYKEAKTLVNNNYIVNVCCLDRDEDCKQYEIIDGIDVNRIKVGKIKSGNFRSVAKGLIKFYDAILKQSKISFDYDIIHCHDFDTMIVGCILKSKYNVPLIYDMHDMYSSFFKNKFSKMLVNKLDRYFYKKSSGMFIVNDDFFKVKGIENACTIYNVPFKKGSKLKKDYYFDLFYAGGLNETRDMSYVYRLLRHTPYTMKVAGTGPLVRDVIGWGFAIKNLDYVGKVSKEYVDTLTQRCKIVLALYDSKFENVKFSLPNKIFDGFKYGKPCIVSKGTTMEEFVNLYECGIAVEYGNDKELLLALHKMNDVKEYERMSKNAFKYFKKFFNWDKMEYKLLESYKVMLK
jgi:glycosyltransferase involved in cell wall biosynthesis